MELQTSLPLYHPYYQYQFVKSPHVPRLRAPHGCEALLDLIETTDEAINRSSSVSDILGNNELIVSKSFPENMLSNCHRHSGWRRERARVALALRAVKGCGPSIDSFCRCGGSMWVLRNKKDPSRYKTVTDSCHSRFCKPCNSLRGIRMRARLAEKLDGRPVRFITLTLKPSSDDLKSILDRLYKAFRKLRTRPIWKNRVLGGASFLEVKRGSGSGAWHPHIHILCQGRYIPQPELSQTWLDVTGDSKIVDVRLVREKRDTLYYVTKYTTKGSTFSAIPAMEDLCELVRALHGRRTVICFGEWRNYRLLRPDENSDWELIGHLNEIEMKSSAGDDFSTAILDALSASGDDPGTEFVLLDWHRGFDSPP